ncbi:DUF5959 family protein [Streptomyces griseofuscus]|uniref:DUF5959 family protein n=1 Tax=Streptomyces griseofuscus TaxID=146922 RepID=UPI00155B135C|nr:DUF5959 family protein [Streptomyces griseofuscus]
MGVTMVDCLALSAGSGSMVIVCVPVVPPDDWIVDHQRRLRHVIEDWVPLQAG